MVVIDMATRIDPKVRVFTIDTGRLPEETHQMMETVRQRYGIPVEIVFPEASEVESMIAAHGPNLFYREVSLRKLCCHIRKVRPLERKLATLQRLGGRTAPLADAIARRYSPKSKAAMAW